MELRLAAFSKITWVDFLLCLRKMSHVTDQGPSFPNLMSRKNILEEDVHFKMAVFSTNYIGSLARFFGRVALNAGAQGTPAHHISRSLSLQVPPALLGQDNGSIWITELMIKERTN